MRAAIDPHKGEGRLEQSPGATALRTLLNQQLLGTKSTKIAPTVAGEGAGPD